MVQKLYMELQFYSLRLVAELLLNFCAMQYVIVNI